MRAATEPYAEAATGVQRGRGGFYRNALDVPYISDPTGATVKSGPRKGLVKWVPYGSTSNFGVLIENRGSLEKWSERKVIEGLVLDPMPMQFQEWLAAQDDAERNAIADRIIVGAKAAAQANLAADRGTHIHAITEHLDRGETWTHLHDDGIALGIPVEVMEECGKAWRDALASRGIEVLAIEASCVDDAWHTAGTLDRIVRTTTPLRFTRKGGEIVEVPTGTVMVLDIKTGSLRRSAAIQIASYAQSVPYDTEAETRGEWPWQISQEHALIAHLDMMAALDGNATCELVYVDLVAGREHGGACVVMAKSWEQRNDVFSVAQLDSSSADGAPVPPAEDLSPADALARVAERGTPDEGGDVEIGFDELKGHYLALGQPARDWIAALTEQSIQAGVSFHSSAARTLRRYELIRGLVTLAEAEICDDEVLRALLELVIGDCAQFANVLPGHALGSLSAGEARTFAEHCDRLVSGGYALTLFPDRPPRIGEVAA